MVMGVNAYRRKVRRPKQLIRSSGLALSRVSSSIPGLRWEFIAENNNPHYWTWRTILADGTTERAADRNGMTFGGALADAIAYGFNPKVDHWEIG